MKTLRRTLPWLLLLLVSLVGSPLPGQDGKDKDNKVNKDKKEPATPVPVLEVDELEKIKKRDAKDLVQELIRAERLTKVGQSYLKPQTMLKAALLAEMDICTRLERAEVLPALKLLGQPQVVKEFKDIGAMIPGPEREMAFKALAKKHNVSQDHMMQATQVRAAKNCITRINSGLKKLEEQLVRLEIEGKPPEPIEVPSSGADRRKNVDVILQQLEKKAPARPETPTPMTPASGRDNLGHLKDL